jgi:drug/metabolite transporter (DMT)-like permease
MIFIIISIFLFSLTNVLWKKNLQIIPVSFLLAYRAFFTSIASIIFVFFNYGLYHFSNFSFIKITLGSVIGAIGLFSMLYVIKKASLQWLSIYNLLGIILTTLYLWWFEDINFSKSIYELLIVVIGFMSFLRSNRNNNLRISLKNHLMLLLMMICFSLSSFIHWKNLDTNIPPILIISNQEIVVFIFSFVHAFFTNHKTQWRPSLKKYFFRVLLMAFVIFLALMFSLMGLKITNPTISSVLFLSVPVLTVLFASVFFKEKFTLNNGISLVIIMIGAFILHYQNV